MPSSSRHCKKSPKCSKRSKKSKSPKCSKSSKSSKPSKRCKGSKRSRVSKHSGQWHKVENLRVKHDLEVDGNLYDKCGKLFLQGPAGHNAVVLEFSGNLAPRDIQVFAPSPCQSPLLLHNGDGYDVPVPEIGAQLAPLAWDAAQAVPYDTSTLTLTYNVQYPDASILTLDTTTSPQYFISVERVQAGFPWYNTLYTAAPSGVSTILTYAIPLGATVGASQSVMITSVNANDLLRVTVSSITNGCPQDDSAVINQAAKISVKLYLS